MDVGPQHVLPGGRPFTKYCRPASACGKAPRRAHQEASRRPGCRYYPPSGRGMYGLVKSRKILPLPTILSLTVASCAHWWSNMTPSTITSLVRRVLDSASRKPPVLRFTKGHYNQGTVISPPHSLSHAQPLSSLQFSDDLLIIYYLSRLVSSTS